MRFLEFLRDWSEVWALLIPLIVILVYKPGGRQVRWVVWYVVLAFILNFLAIFVVEYFYLVPEWMNKGNNIFYNLHSFIMVVFFSCFIIGSGKFKYTIFLTILLIAYIVFTVINFGFWESFNLLSTRHFTAGSIVLLVMCLSFFFRLILEESKTNWLKHPSFLICVAVSLYQAITFFIFLFIYPMYYSVNTDLTFALLMMRIYQGIFIVFCILLAIALYRIKKLQAVSGSA